MEIIHKWPSSIQEYLKKSFGTPFGVKKLNGIKSEGGCYRIKFSNISVIVKQMIEPQEYLFYTQCTKFMNKVNNNIPNLYYYHQNAKSYWIVLEDIPNPLPKERWNADPQVVKVLFDLHSEMWGEKLSISNYYLPHWDDGLTTRVLGLFSTEIGKQIKPLLCEIQQKSQQLFEPYCWINADTNPTNWGIRNDGTVVLFDWERVTCGSPAIDLSITISGLGTSDNSTELSIVHQYLSLWSQLSTDFPLSEQELFQQVKLAKFWSAAEFLGNNSNILDFKTLQDILRKFTDKASELIEMLNE